MNSYFATFIPGTQEIVLRQLKKLPLEQLRVTYIDDGMVIFEASFPPERIIDFRFFNNTFLMLHDFGEYAKGTEELAKSAAIARLQAKTEVMRLCKGKAPRVVAVVENTPTTVKEAANLEVHLARTYDLLGDGFAQFWLVQRRGGRAVLGLRLARPPFKRAKRPAGMLRPELVHTLCLVAGLSAKDTLLDPFAGHGSIVSEALQGFHAGKVIAVEADASLARKLQADYTHDNRVVIRHGSAGAMSFIDDSSIHRVVTDPPWGAYGDLKGAGLSRLYKDSLQEIARVLRPGGVAVILSGNDELGSVVEGLGALEVVKTYNVLVSGKKATVFKLRKPV